MTHAARSTCESLSWKMTKRQPLGKHAQVPHINVRGCRAYAYYPFRGSLSGRFRLHDTAVFLRNVGTSTSIDKIPPQRVEGAPSCWPYAVPMSYLGQTHTSTFALAPPIRHPFTIQGQQSQRCTYVLTLLWAPPRHTRPRIFSLPYRSTSSWKTTTTYPPRLRQMAEPPAPHAYCWRAIDPPKKRTAPTLHAKKPRALFDKTRRANPARFSTKWYPRQSRVISRPKNLTFNQSTATLIRLRGLTCGGKRARIVREEACVAGRGGKRTVFRRTSEAR